MKSNKSLRPQSAASDRESQPSSGKTSPASQPEEEVKGGDTGSVLSQTKTSLGAEINNNVDEVGSLISQVKEETEETEENEESEGGDRGE